MKIYLNMKSIIKYEQLTNKSFTVIDYTNNDDLLKLLYCIIISNNDEIFDFDEFIELLNSKKITKEIFTKFTKIIKLIELFSNKNVDDKISDLNENREVIFFKDVAINLVINGGLDVNYVMNELSIIDIGMFINAYNEKEKKELETKRLFTYLSMLPHIDGNICDSPVKLYSFPWDVIDDSNDENMSIDELNEMLKVGDEIMNKIKNNENLNGK